MHELHRPTFRHSVLCFWLRRKNGELRSIPRQVGKLETRTANVTVLKPFPFPPAAADSKYDHLLVADTFLLAQSIQTSLAKLDGQRPAALGNAFPGNHQDQN